MKKVTMLLACTFLAVAGVCAQTPVPDPDTIQDPVKQTDPAVKVAPREQNYRDDHVKIFPSEVPAAVKKTLEAGSTYYGWEKGAIFKTKNGSEYRVEITTGDANRTFRFDKDGRPLKD